MIHWNNITDKMELNFTVAITSGVKKKNVLWRAIKWISNHLNPEDIFSEDKLLNWHRSKYNQDGMERLTFKDAPIIFDGEEYEEGKDIPRIVTK